ncbi:MAG: hypothetical protein Harvfovirus46_10 [Harvfovirus sp.]|uniref:Uncharacterized protein n=1 Tax=Harvfovirus sp. TaxID=2487768 RepID=A0A3G5A318_9VIRU|nr:MAG: hypothetical protein Harvfovirus46_10 [Harvfovirus sp.]
MSLVYYKTINFQQRSEKVENITLYESLKEFDS